MTREETNAPRRLVERGPGQLGVRIELVPPTVAPVGFQAPQGFVARGRPELAGALEAALVLAAGGFHGPGARRFVGLGIGRGGGVLFPGAALFFPGVQPFLVAAAGWVIWEGVNFFFHGRWLGGGEAGFELGELLEDRQGLVVAEVGPPVRPGRGAFC